MDSLPDEILMMIFSRVGARDLQSLGCIAKRYIEVTRDESLWEPHCASYENEIVNGYAAAKGYRWLWICLNTKSRPLFIGKCTKQTINGRYVGEVISSLFHGYGIEDKYKCTPPQLYIGEFNNYKRDRFGILHSDERTYIGNFSNGCKNGWGIEITGKKTYRGEWKNSRKNGLGMETKNGVHKLFTWDLGKKHPYKYQNDLPENIKFVKSANSIIITNSTIPTRIMKHIMLYIGLKDIANLMFVCKEYYEIISRDSFWRQKCLFEFPQDVAEGQRQDRTYQWLYICKRREFKDGVVKNGVGKYKIISYDTDDEGDEFNIYEGEWKDDKPNGQGCIIYPGGKRFGRFEDGLANGFGIGYWSKRETTKILYAGYWKSGKFDGWAISSWSCGTKYIGYYKNGTRNGKGKYKHYKGGEYIGNHCENRYTGYGKYKYKNGTNYEGEWNDSNWSGYGVLKYKSGSKYEGQFDNDLRHGQGTYMRSNGQMYTGSWINGKIEGQGVLVTKTNIIEKEWKRGEIDW